MSNLTDDERAVLMIAAEGKSLLAIGRWQKPVENLVILGLLKRLDAFNHVITPSGRTILEDRQAEEDEDFRNAYGRLINDQNARQQTVLSGNQSATHLAAAARSAAKISGLTPEQECWQIGQGIIQRALELINMSKG